MGKVNAAEARRSTESTGDVAWLGQARSLVSDLSERRPALYWTDFLMSATAGWLLAVIYFTSPVGSALQIGALLLAGVAFYRAGTFMHEIVHMGKDEMRAFKFVWNAMLGIPLFMPWLLYRNHMAHHSLQDFGTPRDGEYLPLAVSPLSATLRYIAQIPLLPLLLVARFGIAAPLSWLHRDLREWLLARGSAFVSNPWHRRPFPEHRRRQLVLLERLCFGWLALAVLATVAGPITLRHWLLAWLLLAWTLGLNWIRTLAAHGYGNGGERLTRLEQVEDSINIVGQTWLTAWLFPVGLRYHALHHLFPALPYHNLGTAHRRLMRHLPADAHYHRVNHDSFFSVIATLIRGALASSPAAAAMLRWRTQA